MASLRIESGESDIRDVDLGDLEPSDEVSIGRDPRNRLTFADPWLSRFHARIRRDGDRFFLEDLGSRNGTFLNGGRVGRQLQLADGDLVALGDVEIRFQAPKPRSILPPRPPASDPLPRDNTLMLHTRDLSYRQQQRDERASTLLPRLHEVASALISDYPLDDLTVLVLDLALQSVSAERGAMLLRPRRAAEVPAFELPALGRIDPPRGASRALLDTPRKVPTLPLEIPSAVEIRRARSAKGAQGADGLDLAVARGFDGEEITISRTILEQVLANQQAVLTLDAQSDRRFDASLSLQLQGVRSILCVPLWNNREVIGVLYLDHRLQDRRFSEDDLRLVGLIANMAAVKIENLYLLEERLDRQRLDEQLRVGAQIQRHFLPSESPQVPHYDLYGVNHSCFQIGGDYFDFVRLSDQRWAVVLADVSGKGIGAALLMAMLQASLRALAQDGRDPASLMARLNHLLVERSPESKYATVFYAELDPSTHTLEYVNAGHVPPGLVRRSDGTVEDLGATGPVVGLVDEVQFESRRIELAPEEILLLCTDGVTELENEDGEEMGRDRLRQILAEEGTSALELAAAIHQAQVSFCGGGRFDDDSTVVALRRLSP